MCTATQHSALLFILDALHVNSLTLFLLSYSVEGYSVLDRNISFKACLYRLARPLLVLSVLVPLAWTDVQDLPIKHF